MKIKLIQAHSLARKRLLFIMKTLILLLCTTVFSFTTVKSFSQEKIKIDADKVVSVDEVFIIIQNQTKFRFLYPDDLFLNASKVKLKKGVIKVSKLLEDSFTGGNVKFEFSDANTIVVENIEANTKPKPLLLQQKIKISGVVIDDKNQPLPGVNILEKGTKNVVQTDFDGKFSIEVTNQKSILVFSFLGFSTKEITVNDKTNLVVELKENAASLEEVVVVGYGTTKKANLTGSVDQITSKQIERNLGSSTGQLLQGISPNLNVTLGSGDINADASINVRGIGSINNGGGDPLILIDGVQGNMNRINPRDIESISVLKDASSAAIYGARAAYGVVLITTKSAKEGKIKVSYNSNYSWSSPTIKTDNFITNGLDWLKLSDKLSLIRGTTTYLQYKPEDYAYLDQRQLDPTLPSVLIKTIDGAERYVHYGNTDWWDTVFSNVQASKEHNFSLSGGTDKLNVYLSGRIISRDGIYKINKDVLETKTLRAKINAKPYSWLEIGNSTNVFSKGYNHPATNSRKLAGTNRTENEEDWRKYTFHASPLFLPTNPDGSLIINAAYTPTRSIADGSFADLIYGKSKGEQNDFEVFNTSTVTLNLAKKLKIKGDYTFQDRLQSQWTRIIATPNTNQPNGQGVTLFNESAQTYKELQRKILYQAINAYVDYSFNPSKNQTITALAGFNQEWNSFKRNVTSRNGNLSESLNSFNLATGTNYFIGSEETEWAIRAGFYRVKYSLLDRYLIELNGRYDLTSRFPSKSRSGFFPSASAAWIVSKENFWEHLKPYVGTLKFRASYGTLGNQQGVDEYDYISSMGIAQGNYISNGNLTNFFNTPAPVSSNFSWERSETLDFGVDIAAFKNRLSLTYDWFRRNTLDMLTRGKTLPSVFGASSPKENSANLQTKGFELSVKWKDQFTVAGKPFNYGLGFALGDSRTFVTKFDNPTGNLLDYYVGQELGEVWGYTVEGFFQTDTEYLTHADQQATSPNFITEKYIIPHPVAGDIKFADLNGDNKVNPGQRTLADPGDLKKIGNDNPRYNYGITLDAEYLGFDLSVFAQGIMQRDWNPGTDNGMFWGPFSREYQNFYPKSIESMSWTPSNPNAYFPRLAPYSDRIRGENATYTDNHRFEGGQLGVNSDKYLQNAAYLRIKNITLGYTIPQKISTKIRLDQIRLYATGMNLFTFSPLYKNNPDRTVDPEQLGDGNAYPFTKMYAFGLDIKF